MLAKKSYTYSIPLIRIKPLIWRTVISKIRAREIASHWHGGQWSMLYSFCSSGIYMQDKFSEYISEIQTNVASTKKDASELNKLTRWFEYKNWEHGNS